MDTFSFGSNEELEDKAPEVLYFREQIENPPSLPERDQNEENPTPILILAPFSSELESEAGIRRRGVENGPFYFQKVLKNCSYTKIENLQKKISIENYFSWFGVDSLNFSPENFQHKAASLLAQSQQFKNIQNIFIGGSNHLTIELYKWGGAERRNLFKLSPRMNYQRYEGESISNDNYLYHLVEKYPKTQIFHFSILDYLVTRYEAEYAAKRGDGVAYFVQNSPGAVLDQIKVSFEKLEEKNEKVDFLLDLETFSFEYFPGVSSPSIEGLDLKTIEAVLELIHKNRNLVDNLMITNYNPSVEEKRSGMMLVYLLYKYVMLFR